MKLEKKITFVTCNLLLSVAILISIISIYHIREQGKREVARYRTEEFINVKTNLKNLVDVGFGVIENYYNLSQDKGYLQKFIRKTYADSLLTDKTPAEILSLYGAEAQQAILQNGLSELSQLRFDGENGYYWITDNTLPYPTMIMHAAKPENAGKVMNSEKYNTEKYHKKNIYQARAEGCNEKGEAFVEYVIDKPETGEVEEKISYSRLFKPLGWVISSGVYADQIEKMAVRKEADIQASVLKMLLIILFSTIALIGLSFIIVYRFSRQLLQAINRVKAHLKQLAQGQKVEAIESSRTDEIGEMTTSLNNLVSGINAYTGFAKEIGQGNLNHSFEPLSEEDILGNELLQMRDNLQQAAEEDRKRNWSTEGMAMFGDILRKNQDNTQHLCDEVLKTLAEYLKINQGAIYITEEQQDKEKVQLKLTSIYAYNRKKFLEKVIEAGEGMVGQCYLEKETTLLYEIPQEYVRITSGLGQSTPTNLALVPLIHNDVVCGVLEIASFRRWEPYELEFVEKLCESLASTISAVQINESTRQLLAQSQQMAEELKAQEEELRQNQEEMQASQEEMIRNQKELETQNQTLNRELEALKTTMDSH